ncbi:MAG: serine hydrolase [Pirellulales bacterium]
MLFEIVLLTISVLPATPQQPAGDVAAVARAALDQLPGHTGFLFTELTGEDPRVLYALREDERFAIGSSFKLFILGALADEVNADQRGLDNVMRLRADLKGPPHSEMASWPIDSPVTLQTLALKMISTSDNTATDHLLCLLGRERVERQMVEMGDRHAQWNRPLLSTREMTMLRDKKSPLAGSEYQELDLAARRRFLADHFRGVPDYEDVDFDAAAYNLAEWYATPLDMARALSWLKNHTQVVNPAHPLRAVLAVEPKLAHDASIWPYVGFKGGSEDQLLAGNWLLKHKNGRWYTFHVFYNNPHGTADQEPMMAAIVAIFAAIEKHVE